VSLSRVSQSLLSISALSSTTYMYCSWIYWSALARDTFANVIYNIVNGCKWFYL
jgi:hypothetical protein